MTLKFSLQNVLDIRHTRVEVLEIELGKLLTAYQETQSLLMSMQEYQSDLFNQLTEAQSGEIDIFKISLLRVNIVQVNKHIENLTKELVRQELEINNKRHALVLARQSEETLEILKRNRYEIYMTEQVQIEARAQDDIYIAQAFRNTQQ